MISLPLLLLICIMPINAQLSSLTTRQASNTVFPQFTEESCLSLPTLVCNIQPTEGYTTAGVVYFSPAWRPRERGSDLFTCFTRILAEISGLTSPLQGIHVHTYGDLSVKDGSSTGGHFTNPAGDDILHALPNNQVRHWGDFGNLVNDGNGFASYDRIDRVIRLGGVVGRSITIHEGQDMGPKEQPSGASGPRVGFCVIGYSNPEVLQAAT